MRRLTGGFLYIFILIFVTLAALEFLLRLFHVVHTRVVNESIFPGALGDYKPSQRLLSDYVLNYYVSINSLGLRGKEISIIKPPGSYRIMVLGDSYAFGSRVDDDKTFPFQLERMFNDDPADNRNTEVINAGHASYSTREEYEYLMERGLRLVPDMVILAWFPNDIEELGREYSWRDLLKEHHKFEPWKSYARNSAIYNALRLRISSVLLRERFGPYVPKDPVNIFDTNENVAEKALWDKCFEYILKIKGLCDKHKIKFIIVALIDPLRPDNKNLKPQDRLRKFAESNNILFIDTRGGFLSKDNAENYLLPKDPHFSPRGNMIIAQKIYGFLKNNNLKKDAEL